MNRFFSSCQWILNKDILLFSNMLNDKSPAKSMFLCSEASLFLPVNVIKQTAKHRETSHNMHDQRSYFCLFHERNQIQLDEILIKQIRIIP